MPNDIFRIVFSLNTLQAVVVYIEVCLFPMRKSDAGIIAVLPAVSVLKKEGLYFFEHFEVLISFGDLIFVPIGL